MNKNNKSQKGTILVWTMFTMMILVGAITAGMQVLMSTMMTLESHMEYYGQTTAIARAGILDTLSWFRRQTGQPVIAFAPQRDMDHIPVINDTDDADVGLVRELEVAQSRNLYGRYVVSKTVVADISTQRGLSNGTLWYIESQGIVYVKDDPDLEYNVWPNHVVGSVKLATEVRRVSMVLPGQAALCAGDPGQTVIGNKCKIQGGTKFGVIYPPGMGAPNINPGATVTGTLGATSTVTPYNTSTVSVFGMTEAELKSIADYNVDSVDDLPDPIPDYKIVFFEGNATFNSDHPLKGTGIFYITGTLTIAANSGSAYNGIIYCKGHYHQHAPSIINGSVVTLDQVNIESTGDISEIDYDANVISQIATYTGQYRLAKGIYEVK
ncbi:MAG: hypothetical protein HY811_00050 [Planctomycetes bacterium]|nr:hypothetical protein [Planctomycetota bacterium]